jgi:hypothetical protein
VRVIQPDPPKKAVDERLLPREYFKRPVFGLYGTQHAWMTDAQLTDYYCMQKKLKVMQTRVQEINKEEIYNSPKKSVAGLKEL